MRSELFCVSLLLLGIRDDEEWVVLCKSLLTVGGREEWVVLCKSLTVGD